MKLMYIMLPQKSGYVKCFDETELIFSLIEVEELRKAYNKVWDKISNLMQKGLYSAPVYDKEYLKTKITSYDDKINTCFHDDSGAKKILIAFL